MMQSSVKLRRNPLPEDIKLTTTAALVLEGGGMRGLYTCGVLDAFLEARIVFSRVIGVSAGACNACSYLALQAGRGAKVIIDHIDKDYYCGHKMLMKTGNFFSEEFIYHRIPEELYPINNKAYKQIGVTLYACVTNLETGKAELLPVRDLIRDVDKVRASASLPLLSRPVEIGGKKYLDGGVADSLPLAKSERMGNRNNVVVLTQPRDFTKKKSSVYPLVKAHYHGYKEFGNAMKNRHVVYNNELLYLSDKEKKGTCFVIAPETSLEIDRLERDPEKLTEIYERGFHDAMAKMPQLKAFLGR